MPQRETGIGVETEREVQKTETLGELTRAMIEREREPTAKTLRETGPKTLAVGRRTGEEMVKGEDAMSTT